jgi:hypothetical protein
MFLKYVFLLLISISLFLSVQLNAQERESDTIKDTEDFISNTDSLQNSSDFVLEPCTSAFIELLGKGSF